MSENGYSGYGAAPGQNPYAAGQPASAPQQQPQAFGSPTAPTPAGGAGQTAIGPFTIREVALGAVTLVILILSFIPFAPGFGPFAWQAGIIAWGLGILVPVAAVALIVVRRFAPTALRRVGSLSVDQFASVAFSVAAVVWASFAFGLGSAGFGGYGATWILWVTFILALAGVALTVVAPFIPVLKDDFEGREEEPAHRVARAARPIEAKPKPAAAPQGFGGQAPYAGDPAGGAAGQAYPQQGFGGQQQTGGYAPFGNVDQNAGKQHTGGYAPQQGGAYGAPADQQQTGAYGAFAPQQGEQYGQSQNSFAPAESAPVAEEAPAQAAPAAEESAPAVDFGQSAQPQEAAAPAATQAFWALAPEERTIVDENGTPIFTVGPTAWALVIEDRGNAYVVRHEDGRVGFLLDVSGVTRG